MVVGRGRGPLACAGRTVLIGCGRPGAGCGPFFEFGVAADRPKGSTND